MRSGIEQTRVQSLDLAGPCGLDGDRCNGCKDSGPAGFGMPEGYRVDFARPALERLGALSPEQRARLGEMLSEIGAQAAELARGGEVEKAGHGLRDQLLSLQIGRALVRYTVDAAARAVTVQHILVSRPAPFAVVWGAQAASQLAAVHPDIRRHVVKQVEQIAELAGAELGVRSIYRDRPPRDLVWTFEGHTVHYTLDDAQFAVTVARIVAPGERSAG